MFKLILTVLLLNFSLLNSGNTTEMAVLKRVLINGGEGEFNCAFQKQSASRPCQIKVADELTKHHGVLAFSASKHAIKIRTLTILWPDHSKSHYWFSDSLTMFNLDDESGWGYEIRQTPGDGMEIDWRRGFVIEKEGKEYIRLW